MAQKHTLAKMETDINHPYSTQFDDIYFSKENGVDETTHVFINGNNLHERFSSLAPHEIFTIGETGFGTGLNFLIAAKLFLETAPDTSHLYFYSVEKFPLAARDIKKYLSPWKDLFPNLLDNLVDHYPLRVGGWHSIRIHDRITAVIAFDDVTRAIGHMPATIDAWFLDGFAPSKNPDMWSQTVLDAIADHSHENTTLSSFTAAGHVRRGLELSGFHIEKTKGYGHKRDMIIGRFIKNIPKTPRTISAPQTIAIIGAGMAGAQLAYHLKLNNHDVTVFDTKGIASSASGNPVGLYNPRLSAERNAHSDFYASSFSAAYNFFKKFGDDIDFNPCGAFHLINDDVKDKRYNQCVSAWDWHHDHAEIISSPQTANISGVDVDQKTLWLKDSGYVSPYKLCHVLLREQKIISTPIQHIHHNNNQWIIDNLTFDHLILANGAGSIDIHDIILPSLQIVRGQIAMVTRAVSSPIKTALCFGGYLSPTLSSPQTHILGSSFQPWLDDPHIREQDNHDMITKLYETIPSLKDQFQVTGARVGFRAASPDRTPLIGAYGQAPNLWISGAHGSHGLLSSLIAARLISNLISGHPATIGQHIIDGISPNRFEKHLKNDRTKS